MPVYVKISLYERGLFLIQFLFWIVFAFRDVFASRGVKNEYQEVVILILVLTFMFIMIALVPSLGGGLYSIRIAILAVIGAYFLCGGIYVYWKP